MLKLGQIGPTRGHTLSEIASETELLPPCFSFVTRSSVPMSDREPSKTSAWPTAGKPLGRLPHWTTCAWSDIGCLVAIETYSGGCHCGRVRFNVRADLSEMSECNCSICTKKGILHLVVPQSAFELLSGKDELAEYQFNTHIAKHWFCRVCGIHSFYVPRSHPDKYSVNARCLDNVDLSDVRPRHFDGKHWEAAKKLDDERRLR